jgi:hypothetical protein
MWYSKKQPEGDRFKLYGQGGTRYTIKVNPCGQVPGGIFPSDTQPFEAFGYNLSRSFDMADFVLIDNKPIVSNLDLFPLSDTDPARKVLLPDAFDTGTSRAFERVWMQGSSLFERPGSESTLIPGGTQLTLYVPEDMKSDEKDVYEKVAKSVGGKLTIDIAWWTVDGVTFTPTDDGSLKVVACNP